MTYFVSDKDEGGHLVTSHLKITLRTRGMFCFWAVEGSIHNDAVLLLESCIKLWNRERWPIGGWKVHHIYCSLDLARRGAAADSVVILHCRGSEWPGHEFTQNNGMQNGSCNCGGRNREIRPALFITTAMQIGILEGEPKPQDISSIYWLHHLHR